MLFQNELVFYYVISSVQIYNAMSAVPPRSAPGILCCDCVTVRGVIGGVVDAEVNGLGESREHYDVSEDGVARSTPMAPGG